MADPAAARARTLAGHLSPTAPAAAAALAPESASAAAASSESTAAVITTVSESNASDCFARLQATFLSGRCATVEWRRSQLHALKKMVEENKDAIVAAVCADLGKHAYEATGTEVNMVLAELDHTLSSFESWMAPESVYTPIMMQPASSYVEKIPKGPVLIMAPWNYPVNLALNPLVGAIAAGCPVLLKWSRHSGTVAKTCGPLCQQYLDPQAIFSEYTGGASMITELLKYPWAHIFFTGSSSVGKIVYKAAAEHFASVTLELGGKNPVIVDTDVDLDLAARRITWGKFFNGGQTCIGVDTVFLPRSLESAFVAKVKENIKLSFGDDPRASPSYARVISKDHTVRLSKLFADGEVLCGGQAIPDERYVSPTIVKATDMTTALMTDEIFGPVMALVLYDNIDEVLRFVNSRPIPLAAYLFSRNTTLQSRVMSSIRSGAFGLNEVLMHFANKNLPFGGLGASGIGAYHGRLSFDVFTHRRAVLSGTTVNMLDFDMRYPRNGYPAMAQWIGDKLTRGQW